LVTRGFSAATVRAYAYDLVNFGRFCVERGVRVADAVATDFFDYLDWQGQPKPTAGVKVVRLVDRRGRHRR
jgi:integrase/recombinase XerC